ncbi:MAG: thioredoxin domain-containing protein [Candidatus Uhrbacteria bacterium]|nr:thioredoxin domain-containing protein [Candidatus Uhrbacteria bacterium]
MTVLQRVFLVRRAMFVVALAGFFIATYLFVTYTTGGPIVCGGTHGCDLVRLSSRATMFGLPTPLYGMAFYLGMAALLVVRTAWPTYQRRWLYRLTMIGATVGLIESLFLTFVQAFEIKAFCTWCLASAVAATLLFIISWFDKVLDADTPVPTRELAFQFYVFFATMIVGTVAIVFLVYPQRTSTVPNAALSSYQPDQGEVDAVRASLLPEGLTTDGPSDAPVTLVEFVDFECPSCRQAHAELQRVRSELQGKIRFAYRHFPLPIHSHALASAAAAVCADRQGALFPYAELLMEEDKLERADLVRRAAELRLDVDAFVPCLTATSTRMIIERDLNAGGELGVNSTPTFFVNTTMIVGLPNADQLIELIKQEGGITNK